MAGDGAFEPEYQQDDAAALLEQVQANSQALIVATVAFMQTKDVPVAEWATFLGQQFAKDWPEDEPFGADEFLDAMLTNLQGFGARVISADFGPERSTATIADFPDNDLCASYGVDATPVAMFQEASAVIAAHQNLVWDWTWDSASGETNIVVTPLLPETGT